MTHRERIDTVYDTDGYKVILEPCGDQFRVKVQDSKYRFHPRPEILTRYPRALIELILTVKGPVWFTDEIAREEIPTYVKASFDSAVLSYLTPDQLEHARILDFGCGSGASTAIIGRRFPQATIVGIDIDPDLLKIARARADFYKLGGVTFVQSLHDELLPQGLGEFDCIVMSAVYEHLLPHERKTLFPQLWASLRRGGVMIIYETPYRWFPVETHSTGGVPLINYLPDFLAEPIARRTPFRDLKGQDWRTLLRNGLRGGSIGELRRLLPTAIILEPRGLDRIDLWMRLTASTGIKAVARKVFRLSAKILKGLSGIEMVPYLTLALRKP